VTYTSDKQLWLDAEGKVVSEPPASGSLLVGEGGELSDEDAEKYGLTKQANPAEEKARDEPPSNKARSSPPTTKGKN